MKQKATDTKPAKKSNRGCIPIDVDELRIKIFYDAPKALNDADLCKFLGIALSTYYKLKATNKDFSEAIKHYKGISAIEVLSSFKKIAVGFRAKETKKELQKGSDGKLKMVLTEETTKYFAPNATAGIFFLKNKMANQFADVIQHDFAAGTLENITFVIKGKE